LANQVKPETQQTLLWYVHYYYLQNIKPENEKRYVLEQKQYSIFLMHEYLKYMHATGKKQASWQTFDGKYKTFTMDDLWKVCGGR
jgi:hypothetical protein